MDEEHLGLGIIVSETTKRKRTMGELGENEEKYRSIFECAAIGLSILDPDGYVVEANDAVCRFLGYSRSQLIGMHFTQYTHREDIDRDAHLYRALIESENRGYVIDKRYIARDGETVWRFLEVSLIRDHRGFPKYTLVVSLDINRRKRAEAALLESEERFAMAMEATRDGLWDWNVGKGEVYYSPGYLAMLGYSPGDVPTQISFWEDLIHIADRETALQANWNCIQGQCDSFEVEFRMQTKSGEWIWILGRGKCVARDAQGKALRLVGTHVDITDRKKTEEELRNSKKKLRALSARLHSVREEERAQIAQDIHDDLGQRLTGLKMELAWLLRNFNSDQSEQKKKIQAMTQSIDQTVKTVRRISTELRPRILDDFGLIAALEWQALEFANKTGIPCRFQSAVRKLDLKADLSIAVFRIFQEALTNVARHSQATRVEAILKKDAQGLILTIQDNGRGISEKEIARSPSLGLVGMRERALIFGGKLEIQGKKGEGTKVILRLPAAR